LNYNRSTIMILVFLKVILLEQNIIEIFFFYLVIIWILRSGRTYTYKHPYMNAYDYLNFSENVEIYDVDKSK